MRTDSTIGLNPFEIITIASVYDRLYDIEKATLFNVMKRYKDEEASFFGRKIFINSIPGYVLKFEDREKLKQEFSQIVSNFVFEITEEATVTDRELQTIRSIANDAGTNPIAIDDYGMGHSNLVNLINYAPEIIKIDRFLITNIHTDKSKQMLVQSVIDFAQKHDIKVLAEGVETEDELKKSIEMGFDYIQGYFTGKPVYEPIREIDPKVRDIIIKAHEKNCIRNITPVEYSTLSDLIRSMKARGMKSDEINDLIQNIQ